MLTIEALNKVNLTFFQYNVELTMVKTGTTLIISQLTIGNIFSLTDWGNRCQEDRGIGTAVSIPQ